jgi:hypothetical protein
MMTMTSGVTILGVMAALTTAAEAAPSTRCAAVPIYDAGTHVGDVCEVAVSASGLTVVDLSDTWTPSALAPGGDGVAPLYRDTYLALAAERFGDAGADATAVRDDARHDARLARELVASHVSGGRRSPCT